MVITKYTGLLPSCMIVSVWNISHIALSRSQIRLFKSSRYKLLRLPIANTNYGQLNGQTYYTTGRAFQMYDVSDSVTWKSESLTADNCWHAVDLDVYCDCTSIIIIQRTMLSLRRPPQTNVHANNIVRLLVGGRNSRLKHLPISSHTG